MNDKNKKIEEAKEFFKVFRTPKGKEIKVKKITDDKILELHQKIKETFPKEYKEAMQKIRNSNSNSRGQNYQFYSNSALHDAYKFFAYYDVGQKEGYNVSALTDKEVMALYLDIKTNYPTTYNSVMEKMRKTIKPRKVIIPSNSSLSSGSMSNAAPQSSRDTFIEPKKQNNDLEEDKKKAMDSLYPEKPDDNISKNNQDNPQNKELDDLEKQRKQDAADKEAAINSLHPEDNVVGNDNVDLSKFGLSDDENEKDEPPVKVTNKRNIAKDKLSNLLDKLKNDRAFRKNVIIGVAVAVVCIAAIGGAIAYTAVTGDGSAMNNVADVANQAVNTTSQSVDANTFAAASNFDLNSVNLNNVNFDLNNVAEIYSNAGDAANLTGGLAPDPSAGEVYMADLFNNATGEYMNIDPNALNLDELNALINNGDYSVAYTNSADLVGQGGDKLANAGQITGFGNVNDYIDMAKETIQNSKGL